MNVLQLIATATVCFIQLSGQVTANIKKEVTNDCNRYFHDVASAFPCKSTGILCYLQIIVVSCSGDGGGGISFLIGICLKKA